MTTNSLKFAESDETHRLDVEPRRLVVQTAGADAGVMSVALPVEQEIDPSSIELELPGETSPLVPSEVNERNGQYELTFFSADISNSGHLPAGATLSWRTSENGTRVSSLPIVAATGVAKAARPSDSSPIRLAYPRTVLWMVGLAITVIAVSGLIALGRG